jgi:hypothetical protein
MHGVEMADICLNKVQTRNDKGHHPRLLNIADIGWDGHRGKNGDNTDSHHQFRDTHAVLVA